MYNVTDDYKELIKSPVRYTGLSGAVRLKDGTVIQLDDSSIDSGSLQIINKLNRRGDFRPGGVYSGEMSVGLRGFEGKTSDLDGAVLRLNFILYHDAAMDITVADVVPLGRYYVDGSTIKRRRDTVTLSANNALVLFDIPASERSGTLFELVTAACSATGVSFGMTQAEFEALPNGTLSAAVNTARIQTEHDLLMYVGMATASFARIRREDNALEFKPLACEKDDRNMIVPVREIAGNIRFTTEFSDDTTRISQVFTRRKGNVISSSLTVTPGGSEKLAALELDNNPLLVAASDAELVTVLNNELTQLYQCLNRVFDASFTGDPALDIGDYVRLRGGAIDTDRGYATGMITSQTWRYRGQHTIKCTMPSSLTAPGSTSAASIAAYSADVPSVQADEPEIIRVQPKSQMQKELDELRAALGDNKGNNMPLTSYQYLTDNSVKCNGVTYTVEKDADTGLISRISDSNGNSLKPEIPSGITDVALHNAIFWAVAMARGLGAPDPAEELIKSAIYRLYEPDGTIYMTNYVDTEIPQSRLTSSETGVTVAFVLKPSAWAPYYGLWGQHSGNDGQNIQCTKSSGGNSAHLYRHNIGFDLTAGEKYVLIISDQQNTADCYVMKNTVEITEGTPSESTSSAFGNVVLYNSYQFAEQRNYHGIAYDALIWDKALTRSEALAVAKRLMAQHNITGGNT